MARPPLSEKTEVVDINRRWTPDWYQWLLEFTDVDESPAPVISFFDFLSEEIRDGIIAGTYTADVGLQWTAFRNAVAAAYTAGRQPKAVVPAGTYNISTSPNWAIKYLRLFPLGRVVLNFTGATAAFVMDGSLPDAVGANAFGVQSIEIGNFYVITTSATNAFLFKWIHWSILRGTCQGGEPLAGNGFKIDGCVASTFDQLTITANISPFVTARPLLGCFITGALGFQTSFCYFKNCAFEYCSRGLWLDYALGNMFSGGVCEGNEIGGLVLTANAQNNRFMGLDFEANPPGGGGFSAYCLGSYNEFHSCDFNDTSGLIFDSGAVGNFAVGGIIDTISLLSGSINNRIVGATYNRSASGSLSDAGTTNVLTNLYNAATGVLHSGISGGVFGLVVGASPWVYTNETGNNQLVFILGGTVSNISFKQAVSGATQGALGAGPLPPIFMRPGNLIVITYTGTPTVEMVYV